MRPSAVVNLVRKELRAELRTKHTVNFMLLFSGLAVAFFSRISGSYVAGAPEIGVGLLWLVFLFTGMLGLGRAFVKEKELGTLDGLRLTPMSSAEILAGKAVYNLLLMLGVQSIIFPLFIVFFDFPIRGSVLLAFGVLTLGNACFVIVSSALATLVLNARARELLLPVILLPVLFPVIVLSVSALKGVLVDGEGFLNILGEIKIILAYAVVMSTIAILTFDFALEE
ncbi:MAG: ABC transporter permease [Euryarchaeota archaeon]|nr:ABC transporter permease [Euryarchaeota archaeon]